MKFGTLKEEKLRKVYFVSNINKLMDHNIINNHCIGIMWGVVQYMVRDIYNYMHYVNLQV